MEEDDGTVTEYTEEELLSEDVWQLWKFGPRLLDEEGQACTVFNTSNIILGKNPRSGLGYYEPGHYCFVVVDGRSAEYVNINIPRLAQIMSDLGCKQAYNLDGGNTAQVKFNGVYQRKSDPNASQRKVDDILCIGEVAKRED